MRFIGAGLLVAALALPVAAQAPKFVRIDVQLRSEALLRHGRAGDMDRGADRGADRSADLPDTIEIRTPLTLVKAVLENMDLEEEVKINGKGKKGVRVAQLMDILKDAKAGDMLLEVKTSNGDLVKITLE